MEITFWESVKDADNPAMFQAYLTKYPEGNFVLIAKARLDELHKELDDAEGAVPDKLNRAERPPSGLWS